ncbi:hypothetical protein [Streptomyces milbemycinicus]|uniref:V-type ATP synthase subunit E n=1 Tax=Streptomyces milbemycinicus TaxID=476552 RepID=A0ABW8LKF6_9ACTN
MKQPLPDQTVAALAPVRAKLLREAAAEARELLDCADREAGALIAEARARARSLLEEARRQGERDGAAAGRGIRARARRTARAGELAARGQTYEELRSRAVARIRETWGTTAHPALLDRLRERARQLLGPAAEVTDAPDGGVVAQLANRRADYTPDTLAERAVDRLGAEVETLWSA